MQFTFDDSIPVYLQIKNKIKSLIITGEWKPGDRIAPVRELAVRFGVNPNTMQRSLVALEEDGLMWPESTSGRFVVNDPDFIARMRSQVAKEYIDAFLMKMSELQFTKDEISQIIISEV